MRPRVPPGRRSSRRRRRPCVVVTVTRALRTTAWGAGLAKKLDSDHFKLLYDIYHMQIMEGDVIATIEKYHPYINHYHTAGVPGRNEINETQELYYPAIMKAIVDTGYTGFVGQEFIPKGPDPIASLKKSIQICDV